MEQVKTIKVYQAKHGEVIVRYHEDTNEYHVRHMTYGFSYWSKDKAEAIRHAQFLASRY